MDSSGTRSSPRRERLNAMRQQQRRCAPCAAVWGKGASCSNDDATTTDSRVLGGSFLGDSSCPVWSVSSIRSQVSSLYIRTRLSAAAAAGERGWLRLRLRRVYHDDPTGVACGGEVDEK